MGRRGDQCLRLFHEPADVVILQHHNDVAPTVRHLTSALARQHAKRVMIIDGASTAAILAEYGYLRGQPN